MYVGDSLTGGEIKTQVEKKRTRGNGRQLENSRYENCIHFIESEVCRGKMRKDE